MKFNLSILTVVLGLSAGVVSAQTHLRDVPVVRDGIIAVGIAYEISEECGDLRVRLIRGLGYLNSIKRQAAELGYSKTEIDAFIGSRTEKDALEVIARERLANMGANVGDEASYCTVGREEIAKDSAIGRLLR